MLKNMKVSGNDYPIYEMEEKQMFQTTNQFRISSLSSEWTLMRIDRTYWPIQQQGHIQGVDSQNLQDFQHVVKLRT